MKNKNHDQIVKGISSKCNSSKKKIHRIHKSFTPNQASYKLVYFSVRSQGIKQALMLGNGVKSGFLKMSDSSRAIKGLYNECVILQFLERWIG